MIKKLALIGLASALAFGAYAQESTGSESTSTTSTKKALGNKTKGDIDQEITNARMRAASGSKSKFSGSVGAFYDGGSVKDPLSAERPNISGDPGVLVSSAGGGSVSGRYRMDKNNSFTAGVGFSFLQPFQSSSTYENANEFTITNPAVGYSRIYKMLGMQTSSGVSLTYGTFKGWTDIDRTATVNLSHTMMKAFGNSGFSAGVSFSYTNYINGSEAVDGSFANFLGIYPMAEYQFNDTFVARTVFGYFNFFNVQGAAGVNDFERLYEYQSVGLGIVASRDVWIYPNVQFIPDNLDIDNTNIGVSLTMNMF